MEIAEKHGMPEIYKLYRSKFFYGDEKKGMCVPHNLFSRILKDFNKELSRLIIDESVEFVMPLRLGSLRIRKYKKKIWFNPDGTIRKRLSVNWKATLDLWHKDYPGKTKEELKKIKNKPLVYHLNEHTEGYGYMLYWNKQGSNAINKSVYSIDMSRSNDRHLAQLLKTNKDINYYE